MFRGKRKKQMSEPQSSRSNLSIGDVSELTGSSIDTIRYYERVNLMPGVQRTSGGHRVYTDEHVRRLAFIRHSRALGLSLEQIRQIVNGTEGGSYSCEEWRSLLSLCAEGIVRQIDELRTAERSLREMIDACGQAELPNCPVVERLLAGEIPQ